MKKTYSSSGSLDFGFVTLLAAVMTLYVGLWMLLSLSLGMIAHPPKYSSWYWPFLKTEHAQGNSPVKTSLPGRTCFSTFLVPQRFCLELPPIESVLPPKIKYFFDREKFERSYKFVSDFIIRHQFWKSFLLVEKSFSRWKWRIRSII